MSDNDFHVYEVLDDVLFRRGGKRALIVLPCKVVRTRAIASYQGDGFWMVLISAIATGYETLHFDTWFADWTPVKDNFRAANRDDLQGGRAVDVAIPVVAYDYMVASGRAPDTRMLERAYKQYRDLGDDSEPFICPIAAVRIGDRWVEPLSAETPARQ